MRRSAAWLLLASTGCFANPSADPSANPSTPPDTTPQPTNPQPDPTSEPACAIASTPLRRLSHFEYSRTLAALYGDVGLPEIDLPLDPQPHEFDNDAAALQPSVTLLEGYLEIAGDVAARATPSRLTCAPEAPDSAEAEAACARAFVAEQGRLLFRRPLSDAEVDAYVGMFDDAPAEASFVQRAQLTLQLMLTAPEFLYRFERARAPVAPGESGTLDAYSLATRLSFFLWGSTPDVALLDAAEAQAEEIGLSLDELAELMANSFSYLWFDMIQLVMSLQFTEHLKSHLRPRFSSSRPSFLRPSGPESPCSAARRATDATSCRALAALRIDTRETAG